ncbi:MAG: hypothetical protein JSS53_00120 [Proteobacteria bacterium]|nr:hypothetical protein [Pseudomonadota bacterium]
MKKMTKIIGLTAGVVLFVTAYAASNSNTQTSGSNAQGSIVVADDTNKNAQDKNAQTGSTDQNAAGQAGANSTASTPASSDASNPAQPASTDKKD